MHLFTLLSTLKSTVGKVKINMTLRKNTMWASGSTRLCQAVPGHASPCPDFSGLVTHKTKLKQLMIGHIYTLTPALSSDLTEMAEEETALLRNVTDNPAH